MNTKNQRPYLFDTAEADDRLKPQARVTNLSDSLLNMRISVHKIGSKKWVKALLRALRNYDYAELEPIIGTTDNPKAPAFIARRMTPDYQVWLETRQAWSDGEVQRKRRVPIGAPSKQSKRIERALDILRDCPPEWLSWVTVNTTAYLTREDALWGLVQPR